MRTSKSLTVSIRRIGRWVCTAFLLVGSGSSAISETGSGMPLKYISSCELDLNGDALADIALLLETLRGRELVVLMRTKDGYNAFLLSARAENMYLSCHFGKAVQETRAAPGHGRMFQTPGTYIELSQPEGASVAYFWDKDGFKEVGTRD
jgi:hypothetical protein